MPFVVTSQSRFFKYRQCIEGKPSSFLRGHRGPPKLRLWFCLLSFFFSKVNVLKRGCQLRVRLRRLPPSFVDTSPLGFFSMADVLSCGPIPAPHTSIEEKKHPAAEYEQH